MELIKISENKTVSARDLHEWLTVKTEFRHWIERMFEYGFTIENDYTPFFFEHPQNRQQTIDFALSLDCAKEISMIQRTEKGKQARQYFIECEKQLIKEKTPQTYIQALKALVEVEEQKLLLTQKVENLETALDSLVEWVSIIKVCQFNKIKEKHFDWHVLKSKSIEMGYVIKKAQSNRYGYQNLYHVNVFRACYPEFNYKF